MGRVLLALDRGPVHTGNACGDGWVCPHLVVTMPFGSIASGGLKSYNLSGLSLGV